MRARLIPGFLFFAICLGLGYPGLNRYDPRQVEGLRDTQRYVDMMDGRSARTELRVLVPLLARPISRATDGRIGSWNADFFALLVVNSLLVAWTAVLLLSIGERVTGDRQVALIASLLYLLNFNIANVQLAGLVDSVEAWALLAVTWALLTNRWALIPLIGVFGALGKETSIPLLFFFCAAWWWCLASSKAVPRFPYRAIGALLLGQVATVVAVHAVITGEFVPPWELVTSPGSTSARSSSVATLLNREMLYSFAWLLPLGLLRLRRLPGPWLVASAASLVVAMALGIWWGVFGNVVRPAFNAIGPILTLSAAIFLGDVVKARTDQAQT